MKSSAKNISLNSYDDIFSTEETREDAKREKVMDMPLSELHPFPDHPFQVKHGHQQSNLDMHGLHGTAVLYAVQDRKSFKINFQFALTEVKCNAGQITGAF